MAQITCRPAQRLGSPSWAAQVMPIAHGHFQRLFILQSLKSVVCYLLFKALNFPLFFCPRFKTTKLDSSKLSEMAAKCSSIPARASFNIQSLTYRQPTPIKSSCYQIIFSLFSFSAGITPSALPPPLPVATRPEVTRKRRRKATAEAEKKPEQDKLTQTAKKNARNMPVAAVPAAAAETAILGTAEKSSTI